MKVLLGAPCTCDTHRRSTTAYDELVVMLSCIECDSEQTMFMGLETGDLYENAIVAERSDINIDSLESMVQAGLGFLLHRDDNQKIDRDYASEVTQRITSIASQEDVDTFIVRQGKHVFAVVWQDDREEVA